MGAISVSTQEKKDEVVDDLSDVKVLPDESIDTNKLAALKAKSQAKQQENRMAAKIVAKVSRSLNFGILGSGHCGSRLAATFASFGYTAICCNTALQDLQNIALPDSNKLLLEKSLGGAGKDRSIGAAAAEANREQLVELVNDKLNASQVNVLCTSLGGGSGSGSVEVVVDVLSKTGKPLVCLCVLPMESDDVQTKQNALETLSELSDLVKNKVISSLLIVDNAKLEAIFADANQLEFYELANKAVVEPIDMFNSLSSQPSTLTKSIDPTEWTKLLLSEGITVFGSMTVENYMEDTAIAEAVINNLNNNLLASDFDLKQAKYVGFIVTANENTWKKLPSSSINYASAVVSDLAGTPLGVFRGSYVVPGDDVVKVYSVFGGLGLPMKRLDSLRNQAQEKMKEVQAKEEQRNVNLSFDTGVNKTVSEAQKIRDKITAKSSAFSKLAGVSDRRK